MRTPRKSNGHRWRQLRTRVLAEETHCALCGQQPDPTAGTYHDRYPVVDHLIPVARGGSEYDRSNLTLMCRGCNRFKSTMTLNEARAKLAGRTEAVPLVAHSGIW